MRFVPYDLITVCINKKFAAIFFMIILCLVAPFRLNLNDDFPSVHRIKGKYNWSVLFLWNYIDHQECCASAKCDTVKYWKFQRISCQFSHHDNPFFFLLSPARNISISQIKSCVQLQLRVHFVLLVLWDSWLFGQCLVSK